MTTNFVKTDPQFAHRYCTVNQAAGALGISPALVTKKIRSGELQAYQAGRRIILRVADVEALIAPYAPRHYHIGARQGAAAHV